MSKFLNISTDNTLGGNNASDDTVASQKAVKDYVDNLPGLTVDQTYDSTSTNAQSGTAVAEAVVGAGKRNIGEIIESVVPLTDAGLHLLDGSLISGSGSYSEFVTYIAGLVSGYPYLFETEANWQTSVTNYGVCGKFVYDSVNNTVRLPKITGFTEGTITLSVLGDLTQAGLPNIETSSSLPYVLTANSMTDPTGIGNGLYISEANKDGISSAGSVAYRAKFAFDASRSSSIYGNSTIVQPQSIKVLYYIVIANSTKTEIEVDIDEVMADLNGKADVDLTNVNTDGTSLGASWAMPSSKYDDLTLGASGTYYTAPANGYYVINKTASATNQYVYLYIESSGMSTISFVPATNNIARAYIPVKTGDRVQCSYNTGGTTNRFIFVYAEGEN